MAEAPEVFERRLRPRPSDIISPGESEPKRKKRNTSTPTACIQSLPSETLEKILRWMSIPDIISFGATCHAFHRLSLSPALWRDIYYHGGASSVPSSSLGQPPDWRRVAIMKHTQTLLVQRLSGQPGGQQCNAVTCAVAPSNSLGYRRVLVTRDLQLLWDHQGSVFWLNNTTGATRTHRSDLFCQEIAKDVAVDPRSDISYREYVYVLTSCTVSSPASTPGQTCDCVMIHKQATGNRVFRMSFHPSLKFTQICLAGSNICRTLLLLSNTGKVYSLSVDETWFSFYRYATLHLKRISTSIARQRIAQIHTSYNAELYLTTKGSVFLDVHSAGMYRRLFGTNEQYNLHRAGIPLPLPLPSKVVRCSLGPSHLCLLDDRGRMFMQGSNRYGELGTGDKIDRGQPAPVVLGAMTPVEVTCGLNHTLALLQGESGAKEVQGCGCGAGGRLPGWPGGSAVFVRLSVTAPRTARSICTSTDSLFLLCCHDTAEPPLCPPPPSARLARQETRAEREEREILWRELSQMKVLAPRGPGRLKILQDVVKNRMTLLSPVQRDFLVDALELI